MSCSSHILTKPQFCIPNYRNFSAIKSVLFAYFFFVKSILLVNQFGKVQYWFSVKTWDDQFNNFIFNPRRRTMIHTKNLLGKNAIKNKPIVFNADAKIFLKYFYFIFFTHKKLKKLSCSEFLKSTFFLTALSCPYSRNRRVHAPKCGF